MHYVKMQKSKFKRPFLLFNFEFDFVSFGAETGEETKSPDLRVWAALYMTAQTIAYPVS